MASSMISKPWHFFWHSSFLYPLKGIGYFVAHPAFWPLFRARLFPIILLSAFVFTVLFVFAYLPIVVVLEIFHYSKSAWFNAFFIILQIEAVIVALLFEAFLVDETLVDVFDAVLINEDLAELVATKRTLNSDTENPVERLGKLKESAVFGPLSIRQIIEYVVYAPLTLIPWAGVPLYLLITGYRAGPFYHWRFFQLLGFTKKERKAYIKQRKLRYTWFGTVALILMLTPGLNMFFLLTNAAGSGLWAAEIQKRRAALEAAQDQFAEEPYHDDPI